MRAQLYKRSEYYTFCQGVRDGRNIYVGWDDRSKQETAEHEQRVDEAYSDVFREPGDQRLRKGVAEH